MSSKSDMELLEMFNLIVQPGLTPNQFYLMYCMKEGIASININLHQELRSLQHGEWLSPDNKLTPKAHSVLQQVEAYFRVQKKKTTNQVLGKDYGDNIDKYLLLFPKMKLPSGKAARSDKRNCETAFKWFFENHQYSWETILKASAAYVDEYERNNYLYMQTSQYFIRKQLADKTWGSELANWCSVIENGDIQESTNPFTEKVV